MQYEGDRPFDDQKFDLNNEDSVPQYIDTFLGNGYQCKVNGSLDISKVTGQLHFRQRGDSRAYNKWRQMNMQKAESDQYKL